MSRPLPPAPRHATLTQRWARRVILPAENPNEGCWGWLGTKSFGYGEFATDKGYENKHYKAHRFSWQAFKGPIPDGLHVCHACDNPECCNPSHLFLGTAKDNMADMVAKGRRRDAHGRYLNGQSEKTHCVNGHELAGDNVYLYGTHRRCRVCRTAAATKYRNKE